MKIFSRFGMLFAYLVFLDVLEVGGGTMKEFSSIYVNLDTVEWFSYSDNTRQDIRGP